MSFDALIANPGRLKILTALAVEERQQFVDLRRRTSLTDGNLAAHAKRLQGGGLIEIDKQFKQGKPVTSFVLTLEGRKALESHARRLIAALSQRRMPSSLPASSSEAETPTVSDRKITSRPLPIPSVRKPSMPMQTAATSPQSADIATMEMAEDEWVD